MIKHIVFWNLKDTAEGRSKQENALLIKQGLEGLVGRIDGLLKAEVGIGLDADGYDLCLYSEFSSKEALDAYQVHPEHDKVRKFVRSVNTARAVCDYEV